MSRGRPGSWWRRGGVLAATAVLALVAVAILATMPDRSGPGTGTGQDRRLRELTYPRTGLYFLEQEHLPPIDTLARYDLVVIDNDWANRKPPSFFQELRDRNPRLRLLAYVNLVDSMNRLGSRQAWANHYDLWQFQTPNHSTFPREWLAHTASGVPVHEWEDRVMTNLTDVCPTVDGQRFVEYAADWVARRVWTAGIWDGVYLDVWGDTIWAADQDRWDIDGDGTDEARERIYGKDGPLDRGLTIAERIMRERMPGAILVANGTRTLREGLLDGLARESFADPLVRPNPIKDVEEYVAAASGDRHRLPGTAINISKRRVAPGSAEEYRRARFALAATLLQNGYWAVTATDGSELLHVDEMDGGGVSRGYLGHPLERDLDLTTLTRRTRGRTGSPAPNVHRRDFEHGIVLVNLGAKAQEITLEREYRHLDGTQDRSLNDGRVADRVTLRPQDAVFLLRVAEETP